MAPIPSETLNLVRLVGAIAWSDGNLAADEANLLLEQFTNLFALDEMQQLQLVEELQNPALRHTPIAEFIGKLSTEEDRELALKLGFMVIQAGGSDRGEPAIAANEKVAYRQLVELLALPETAIANIERAAHEDLVEHASWLHAIAAKLSKLMKYAE